MAILPIIEPMADLYQSSKCLLLVSQGTHILKLLVDDSLLKALQWPVNSPPARRSSLCRIALRGQETDKSSTETSPVPYH